MCGIVALPIYCIICLIISCVLSIMPVKRKYMLDQRPAAPESIFGELLNCLCATVSSKCA